MISLWGRDRDYLVQGTVLLTPYTQTNLTEVLEIQTKYGSRYDHGLIEVAVSAAFLSVDSLNDIHREGKTATTYRRVRSYQVGPS